MTGEAIKRLIADACREAGYVVLFHADGRHGPAEGMPDLRIIGPWANRQTCLDLECKSAREKLRPAQQRYADAACQVGGDGYVYAVVRQTPEAPGELAARTVAFMLGLPDLARRLPAPGPGAVYGEPAASPFGENAVENSGRVLELLAEGHGRLAAERIAAAEAELERRRAAGGVS